jgi:hypothetical protein
MHCRFFHINDSRAPLGNASRALGVHRMTKLDQIPTTKTAIKSALSARGFTFGALLAAPMANPKIAKSAKKAGVMTFVMHLAPHTVSGFNTCASATDACILPCLDQSGNPAAGDAKRAARIARTQAFFRARPLFLALLKIEIDAAIRKAKRANMDCAFRLNGTSDIRFESVRFPNGQSVAEYVNASGATIYDYTKHSNRRAPEFYNLTFSYLGDETRALAAFESGLNIAIVFDVRRNKPLPRAIVLGGKRIAIHDADEHDARFLDPKNVVCGLRYKFKTTRDAAPRAQQIADGIESGFIVASDDARVIW